MLHIYPVVLDVIHQLRPVLSLIERKDRDLGRQLRRASASIALNLAEGMYSRGKNRSTRYHTALGLARETLACIEVAQSFGYLGSLDAGLHARLRQVIGTLVRLVERSH